MRTIASGFARLGRLRVADEFSRATEPTGDSGWSLVAAQRESHPGRREERLVDDDVFTESRVQRSLSTHR